MAVSETGRTVPSRLAVAKTGWWLAALVEPTAMTLPPVPTAAPFTDSATALPSDPVGAQVPPAPSAV